MDGIGGHPGVGVVVVEARWRERVGTCGHLGSDCLDEGGEDMQDRDATTASIDVEMESIESFYLPE